MLNIRALERWRPWPVYLMAAAVPISMAATSLSKALILIVGLMILLIGKRDMAQRLHLREFRHLPVMLALLAASALSIGYTSAALELALGDWGKHAKLILIPLILLLLRTRRECLIAVAVLLVAQSFVLFSSCLLAAGWILPWVPVNRNALATVYSSYLDQAIMTAGYAAMCWHLRHEMPDSKRPWLMAALAVTALLNVLILLPGRSGQMAMLAVAVLALWWALPSRWRVLVMAAPFVFATLAAASNSQFGERMGLMVEEIQLYHNRNDITTSIGIRLNFWHRSLQAIGEQPLIGHGVASWSQQFLRLAGPEASLGNSPRSNPHQEYLQWGVELGMVGIGLLLWWMWSLLRDAQRFSDGARHATQSLVVVMAVACLFNSALFDALIGDYFCVALGILLAYGSSRASDTAMERLTA